MGQTTRIRNTCVCSDIICSSSFLFTYCYFIFIKRARALISDFHFFVSLFYFLFPAGAGGIFTLIYCDPNLVLRPRDFLSGQESRLLALIRLSWGQSMSVKTWISPKAAFESDTVGTVKHTLPITRGCEQFSFSFKCNNLLYLANVNAWGKSELMFNCIINSGKSYLQNIISKWTHNSEIIRRILTLSCHS